MTHVTEPWERVQFPGQRFRAGHAARLEWRCLGASAVNRLAATACTLLCLEEGELNRACLLACFPFLFLFFYFLKGGHCPKNEMHGTETWQGIRTSDILVPTPNTLRSDKCYFQTSKPLVPNQFFVSDYKISCYKL